MAMINCIQQVGLGVPDVQQAFRWVRHTFGMDIPVFEDEGEAPFMVRYTGNEVQRRYAILAENLQGGSAFEIWQYLSRTPKPPSFSLKLGDLGIFLAKIKSQNIGLAFETLKKRGTEIVSGISHNPVNKPHMVVRDPFGNLFQIVEDEHWFRRGHWVTGGGCGCLIGVSDMGRAKSLYADVLGYNRVVFDEEGVFDDFASLPGGDGRLRRVLLVSSQKPRGIFAKLVGPGRIELVQALDRKPSKIFGGRYWGDPGFMHLCFDVHDMKHLEVMCAQAGFPFVVDTGGPCDMGKTKGHFSYIEDPDGTLIEFVEIYKMLILKKLNKRDPGKPLPDWLIRLLALGRVKD
jgi:catechol 2,3-dioxygenase-like lactoylglutathione lyase family enzyme